MTKVAGLKLLVADDEIVNRKLMQAILENARVIPQMACNGLEALQSLTNERFDGAILDINMPIMDGAEAVRRFRIIESDSSSSRMPIVACSAISQPNLIAEFMAAGFDLFLPKPISMASVADCLSWIQRQSDHR